MNILFIADQYNTGGAADALVEMANLLKKDYGCDVTILTGHKDELGDRLRAEGLHHVFCGYRQFSFTKHKKGKWRYIHKVFRPLYIFLYHIHNLKARIIVRKKINMEKIDIIHTNVNRNDFGAILAARYRIPHVWQLRECPTGHFVLGFNRRSPSEYMNSKTTRFVAISDFVKGEWANFGLDKNKIDVIYDGVDLSEIKEKENYEKDRTIKIVCVGDITPQKGQHLIIDALKDINISNNRVELDFWGNGNKQYIESLQDNLELKDNISINFKGYNAKVKTILKHYDMGINPSINEGFGRTTIEYMAAGLCVLALNSGGNKELIKDRTTGFLFDDSNDLVQLIEECIKDDRVIEIVGRRGKQWARCKMDMCKNIESFYSLYSELVMKKSVKKN